jgi:radical SAM superfamily enzyme YgiQ (UPF0313 family)
MKIKLIAPARKPEWGESFWDLKTLCKLTGRKAGGAPLALPTLAALTPSDVEVVLTDENVEPVDFEEKVDLVGITGMTCVIPRSYEIADEYRKRGIPVVMGGIHVSMLPEEAIQHCDAVVIGEAEEVWEQVVRDAQKKNLQKFYRAPRFPDLTNAPIPRWDLLKNDKYCYFTIQTGRGCPYDCEFCSVKVFNGREYRHKRIDEVVKEIEYLQNIDSKKWIFFNDDNILAIPDYARKLFKAIIPFEINVWWCQASLNKLSNDELLDLMYKSGCRVIFVGFESISEKSLISFNKDKINNINRYKEIVDKVHSYGISIFGSFVLGGDYDTKGIFKDTINFIMNTDIAFSMINIMVPLPGTKLNINFNNSNRILDEDWHKYNAEFVTFKPNHMSTHELKQGHSLVVKEIYSYNNLYKRMYNLWNKKVFVRKRSGHINFFSRGRMLLTLKNSLSIDKERFLFVIRGLWNKNGTSVTSILLGLNFHNYAFNKSSVKK